MDISKFKDSGRKEVQDKKIRAIYERIQLQKQFNKTAKKDFIGNSYNLMVGRFNYPNINVGVLSVEDENEEYDNPKLWSSMEYDIPRILNLRASLINSAFKTNIKSFNERLMDMSKEISLAKKEVDVEINLKKKPVFNITLDRELTPYGPRVKLENAKIIENPKIPHQVEYVTNDIYLKAGEGLENLYKKGFDEHYLTKIFSMGNLGLKTERKLVPTRWSITAVDDTLGKKLINEIKKYKTSNYLAYFGSFLGNNYLILVFPEVWSYELFETSVPTQEVGTDYESYDGRKEYAFNTVGGYYAARLAILEQLSKTKRQGSVLCLRFITDDYYAHLGVWVCRQSVRKAVSSKPLEFDSEGLMLKYAKKFVEKKFGYNLNKILNQSKIIKNIKEQNKITRFF